MEKKVKTIYYNKNIAVFKIHSSLANLFHPVVTYIYFNTVYYDMDKELSTVYLEVLDAKLLKIRAHKCILRIAFLQISPTNSSPPSHFYWFLHPGLHPSTRFFSVFIVLPPCPGNPHLTF